MTCIVGLVNRESVYIGADSAGLAGLTLSVRADEKVFGRPPFLMGFTTSFRMGQLLRYKLSVPLQQCSDVQEFMSTIFIDSVRQCLKEGGWATTKDGRETGGIFLVGYQHRLFRIDSDFQVGENCGGFDAVGAGEDIALGALFATEGKEPLERILIALRAAERYSAAVRGPFIVMHLEPDGDVTAVKELGG